jgi:hypothetical protein
VRHHPERALDDGIIGPRWLSRDELAAQPQRWRSHLVLRCIDDYLAGGIQQVFAEVLWRSLAASLEVQDDAG